MSKRQWGDQITYTQATGWYHQGQQGEEDGPYTGGIVGIEENGLGGEIIQVRADGWGGEAPIYGVRPSDIITTRTSEGKQST
jgi:hypothetical protein